MIPANVHFRRSLACLLGLLLLARPSYGLVSINDGKNQLFVVGTVTYAYDSNIFASSDGGGDSIYTASVGLEIKRRAGLIGVNASMYLDASKFAQNSGENFQNPRFRTEFTKQTGRTTGSLTLGAARESRADAAANMRNESWSYEAALNLKYPVIERYSISGGFQYALRDFKDNRLLVDLSTYAANVDLFYVYNTERDLIGGYRVRYSQTSKHSSYYDHAFTVGLSGKILAKLGGTVRVGYQFREPSNRGDPAFSALTMGASATWNLTKRANATLQLAKDFSTTSTNISVDTTTANLDAQYVMNSRTSLTTGIGYGMTDFLGVAGAGRKDHYFTWNCGANLKVQEHLTMSLTYAYFQNWSNVAFADFTRNSVTLTANSQF